MKKIELRRIDVVLLGDFNPKIFTPAWLAAQELIGEEESKNSNVEILTPDIAVFNLSWCQAQITRNRFAIFTEQDAYFTHLYDLIANIFQILEHTPIHTLGYNWGMHFICSNEEEWHAFGHSLVPQNPWKNIFKDSAMLRLDIVEKYEKGDPLDGRMQVRVEPSRKFKYGVFININDHYEVSKKEEVVGCSEILSAFKENWSKSEKTAMGIVEQLFENLKEKE